jgi:hypothetical protein
MSNQSKFFNAFATFTLASAVISGAAHSQQAASAYAGEQYREVKALSKGEIDSLNKGAGMGYAKAAELNGYPGPMHVLELSSTLKLTDAQREATEKLLNEHKREAREIGAQIVDLERKLDVSEQTVSEQT